MIQRHQDIPNRIKAAGLGATLVCQTATLRELTEIAAGVDRLNRPDLHIREATREDLIARGIDPDTGEDAFEGIA